MIRFPYILNVKYPYGTQHYYSITLSWCCVHVEIRVDVGSDITSHYLSHIHIMVDVRNYNYVSDITRNHHYDSDITLSIVKIMVDVGNDN